MINPLRGILLDGLYYGYIDNTFRKSIQLRSSVSSGQASRLVSTIGSSWSTFVIQLSLDSNYIVRSGDLDLGSTTWIGISRLTNLERTLSASGVSMPIVFVAPYGVTYNVSPIGVIDTTVFNPENPGSSTGMEFRVSLTLDQV